MSVRSANRLALRSILMSDLTIDGEPDRRERAPRLVVTLIAINVTRAALVR
jgi:hypothetical protein